MLYTMASSSRDDSGLFLDIWSADLSEAVFGGPGGPEKETVRVTPGAGIKTETRPR